MMKFFFLILIVVILFGQKLYAEEVNGLNTRYFSTIDQIMDLNNELFLLGSNGCLFNPMKNSIDTWVLNSFNAQVNKKIFGLIRDEKRYLVYGPNGTLALSDDGESWKEIKCEVSGEFCEENYPMDLEVYGDKYYLSGSHGVWESEDFNNWNKVNSISVSRKSILINSKFHTFNEHLYYVDSSSIYTKYKQDWKKLSANFLPNQVVNLNRSVVGIKDNYVYKSDDMKTWKKIFEFPNNVKLTSISVNYNKIAVANYKSNIYTSENLLDWDEYKIGNVFINDIELKTKIYAVVDESNIELNESYQFNNQAGSATHRREGKHSNSLGALYVIKNKVSIDKILGYFIGDEGDACARVKGDDLF